jgi:hypothetical protein
MIIARPSVAEERWLTLASRYPALRAAAEATGRGGQWKTASWLSRCLGFLLGLLGAGMLAGVLSPFPSPWLIGGLLLMVAAEWLVAQRRVLRSGIEEAVYLCGAVAAVVQILVWSKGGQEWIGIAMIATAVLLVGWRLLNPLFTTLAVSGYSLALAARGGGLFSSYGHELEAALFSGGLAVAALIAGARQWRRPSHDRMLDGLVVVMPCLAYGWFLAHAGLDTPRDRALALAIAAGFLLACLIVGCRRRTRAPLLGALALLACTASALSRMVDWSAHWQIIIAGALLLGTAVILERLLRHRDAGLTSRLIDESVTLDLAQMAGAARLTPGPAEAPPAPVEGQGGSFGGAGASGRF